MERHGRGGALRYVLASAGLSHVLPDGTLVYAAYRSTGNYGRVVVLIHDRVSFVHLLLFALRSHTLHRRLAAEGTTFRELVAACRYDIARQLLETSDIEMTEIADTLGYAEASVFTRAFHRWSGTTPTRWREQQRRV